MSRPANLRVGLSRGLAYTANACHSSSFMERQVRGRLGFDAGCETLGACRVGNRTRKSTVATSIVANDENYGQEFAIAA